MIEQLQHNVNQLIDANMELSERIEDLSRRQAAMFLSGKVAEVDGNKVRLELGEEDQRTGKKFLSPWVQIQDAAGATGTHFPVKEGDPMRLMSPNGELGAMSLAIRDSHTDENPNPADKNTDLVIAYGGGKLLMQEGKLILSAGGTSVELSGGKITVQSGELIHNNKNIGDTHIHDGVLGGAENTGEPV